MKQQLGLYVKNGANIDALNSIARYAWKFGLGVEQRKNCINRNSNL